MALVRCRECGDVVSDAAPSCPKCGVADPGFRTAEQKTEEQARLKAFEAKTRGAESDTPQKRKLRMIVAGVALIAVLGLFNSLDSKMEASVNAPSPPAQEATRSRDQRAYVYVAVRNAVRARLKYPDSAEFPGVTEYPAHVHKQADGTYAVASWVKAQTPLGMKKTMFAATAREVMPDRFEVTGVELVE